MILILYNNNNNNNNNNNKNNNNNNNNNNLYIFSQNSLSRSENDSYLGTEGVDCCPHLFPSSFTKGRM
jgi:hypothetical protein